MSVREYPSEDSGIRSEKAEDILIEDIRVITGADFGVPNDYTVYEIDAINENDERRDNVVVIPRILFESTKDVQYRHEYGIVGKYTRALVMENDRARDELQTAINEQREQIKEEVTDLTEKEERLLYTLIDLGYDI